MFITDKSGFGKPAFGDHRWVVLLCAAMLTACNSTRSPGGIDGSGAASPQNQRGELLSYACLACHSFGAGGEHQIGPNLYGVFGRAAGSLPDFDYSPALHDAGFVWTPAELDRWLADPTGFLPGTSMAFSGYQQLEDRQALIDYLVVVTSP